MVAKEVYNYTQTHTTREFANRHFITYRLPRKLNLEIVSDRFVCISIFHAHVRLTSGLIINKGNY